MMPKIIVTAEVEDAAKWEQGFRTHGDLFKSQSINHPIQFSITGDNEVVICFEADDVEKYVGDLESPATIEAMTIDGVKRDTVKVRVLDKEFDV